MAVSGVHGESKRSGMVQLILFLLLFWAFFGSDFCSVFPFLILCLNDCKRYPGFLRLRFDALQLLCMSIVLQ